MSKRPSGSGRLSTKKFKFEDVNDVFGDDFDGEAIEDCFRRATQVFKEEENKCKDVTLMPSYSVFKETKHISTSTQFQVNGDCKIQKFEEKYAEKEGEVAILRLNIQNLRENLKQNQDKLESEWKEKMTVLEKENRCVKSELQFKNLEIAKLRQQLSDLPKVVANEQSFLQFSQRLDLDSNIVNIARPESPCESRSENKFKIDAINVGRYFPLESFSWMEHYCDNEMKKDKLFDLDEKVISLIYKELSLIVHLSIDEINSAVFNSQIVKITWICFQILENLNNMLKRAESALQENGERSVKNVKKFRINKLSPFYSEIVRFISELAPVCEFFRSHITTEYIININQMGPSDQELLKFLEKKSTVINYLPVLLSIVTIIIQMKIEDECLFFLSTLLSMLHSVFASGNIQQAKLDVVEAISKQFLLLNLKFEMISPLIEYLKVITEKTDVIYKLCSKNGNTSDENEVCRFHTFFIDLEAKILGINDDEKFSTVTSNFVDFAYAVIKTNHAWLYYQEKCKCIGLLSKLVIKAIYENGRRSHFENIPKKHVKILNILAFNTYNITHKLGTDLAHYKEFMYNFSLKNEEKDLALKIPQNLKMTEHVVEVPRGKFFLVDF